MTKPHNSQWLTTSKDRKCLRYLLTHSQLLAEINDPVLERRVRHQVDSQEFRKHGVVE